MRNSLLSGKRRGFRDRTRKKAIISETVVPQETEAV